MRACLALLAPPVALLVACGGDEGAERSTTGSEGSGGSLNIGGGSGGPGGLGSLVRTCDEACRNFPASPLFDGSAQESSAELFAELEPTDGGCIMEPQDDAMVPANWLRPRIRWTPAAGQQIWKIRVQAEREANDLVVYTTNTSWVMPLEIWQPAARNDFGDAWTIVVEGTVFGGGPVTRTEARLHIAPVQVGGALVYWATTGPDADSWLVGFGVGEEGTVDALRVEQVQEFPVLEANAGLKRAERGAAPGEVRCIGCHTSTPDGGAVAFTDGWPWNSVLASVEEASVGQRPDYVTQAASRIIQQPWQGTATFSIGDWGTGRRRILQSFGDPERVGWPGGDVMNKSDRDRLVWFDLAYRGTLPDYGADLSAEVVDLEGEAFGFLARDGDERGAVNPNWSHDSTRVAYVSTTQTTDGHAGPDLDSVIDSEVPETDIYIVPFNEGAGGDAVPLLGASEPGVQEYYPDFSFDDELIAFTRADQFNDRKPYYREDGEIWVVPASGGNPEKLAANDPPACGGETSPGVINSWPKWSPSVQARDGKKYYWLVFSSARAYPEQITLPTNEWAPADTRSSQLYMAGVVVEDGRIVSTHSAVYLWNQTTHTTNLTPAWDEFQLPPVDVR